MNKKIFLSIFAVVVVIVSAVTTVVYKTQKQNREVSPEFVQPEVLSAQDEVATPLPDFTQKNIVSVLLLGYGGAGHEGGFLSDVIQVVVFNFEKQQIAFISIPRDLYVSLPDGTTGKINSAFSMGNKSDPIHSGAEIAKKMAAQVTGIPIDVFVSVDFVGFKRAVGGILDGLEVNVTEPLDDPWYPIEGYQQETCGKSAEEVAKLSSQYSGFELEKQFECRYEHIKYNVGANHMEGGDALAYVRSRHGSAGGDFSRSKRQQEVLLAVRDKLFSLKALEKIPEFFKEMIAHTDTDLTIDIITTLAPKLATTKDMKTVGITLSTQNVLQNSKSSSGAYIVIPKAGLNSFGEIQSYIQEELN